VADRVFLDANVLFSAAYRRNAGLARLWERVEVRLLSSEYALAEAELNLGSAEQRSRLAELRRSLEVVPAVALDTSLPEGIELPEKDRPILAAAIHAGATHLLTGDIRDFGSLFGRTVSGVLILRPSAYVRRRE
jgi:predicted nucleic acid-binding protein